MVTGIDDQFGRILRVLKEEGLDKNTIVVFASDHGEMLGSHKRSGKTIYYDEALLIPFLIRWPGHIKPGVDKLHYNVPDMAPTLRGLMGFKNKIPKAMQGYNQANIFLGKKGYRPEGSLYWNSYRGGSRGWRDKQYSYIVFKDGREILFDNIKDPYQLNNIVAQKVELAKKMKKQIDAELKRIDDPWSTK
jgi:uncharacterized sulfatase